MTYTDARSEFAVDARDIARRFGSKWVLRGVSAQVRSGEIVALMGGNGSGKTTLLRILSTLLKPSAGGATVYGKDVVRDADTVRGLVNYLSHTPGLYEDLTARENLAFAARMSGLEAPDLSALLNRVGLSGVANQRVRGFSSGMQRRLALARLFLRPPKLLLLDEPYNNLDSGGAKLVNEVLREAKAGGAAAIIVLHETAPADDILDRTITLENGRAGGVPASLVAIA
jgi:heme exporter protein A